MTAQPSPPERKGFARLVMGVMRRFSPDKAAAAERESREWFLVCNECDNARSYAELGGVRYGASGTPPDRQLPCPVCRKRTLHRTERRPEAAAPGPADS